MEAVVLEEPFVLGIQATPGLVTFDVDLVLTPDHPAYGPPPSNETECFRHGRLRFVDVRRSSWEGQGRPPAMDASGEIDFGHIDSLVWDETSFALEGDWGRMEVSAGRVEVEILDLSNSARIVPRSVRG